MRNLLPQSDVLTDLVCFFFDQSTVPWVHPFLHRPTFNYNLAQFTSEPENPSLFDFGGLLSVVCLLALQYLPGEPLSVCLYFLLFVPVVYRCTVPDTP